MYFLIAGVLVFINAMIEDNLENKNRRLAQELLDKRLRIALSLRSSQDNIRYKQLVNEHFASVKLADEAFSILRQTAKELHKINELIKQAKQERKACRNGRDFVRANDITRTIVQLAKIYTDLKRERDAFRTRTRELNDNTAELRETIRSNCGVKGVEWHQRLQARKRLN